MVVVALIGFIVALLDIVNIWSGAGAKVTPILLATIILFLVYDSQQLRRLRQMMRGNTATLPNSAAQPERRPNKKRQPNPQPEYRSIAWHGLTLRSHSEVKIAKALDNKGVLFLADPKIRLKTESHRQTREVDFLVHYDGKWGILEVDGPHHQHSAKSDEWRDARFGDYGLLVIRYPADQCYREPGIVVENFLEKLAASTLPS